jgi:hypothetical protein
MKDKTNEYQDLTLRIVEKDGEQYTCFEWVDTETNQVERRYCKNINEELKETNQ